MAKGKDFRLTAILAVRDTLSPVLAKAKVNWAGFHTAVESTEFSNLSRVMKLTRKQLKGFASEVKETAKTIGYPFTALASTIGFSLQSAITGFASRGDAIDKMSARLGVGAERLQEWTFAATHAGAAPEQLEDALKDLSQKITEVASGDKGDAAQLFEALGISVKDAAGKIRPTEAIFNDVADAIQRNENPAIRTKMAMVLMGDSGRKLIPMLSNGAKGLGEMAQAAREAGLVISQDAVSSAATMTDHMDDMKATLTSVSDAIGAKLSPAVIRMSDRFANLAKNNKEAFSEKFAKVAEKFAEAIERIDIEAIANGILKVADVALTLFNAMGGVNTVMYGFAAFGTVKVVSAVVSLGSSLMGLMSTFGTLATAVKGFGVVLTTSMGPIGWVLGAIGLAAGLVVANWDKIGPHVMKVIDAVVNFASTAWEVLYTKFSAVGEAILGVAKSIFTLDFKGVWDGFLDLVSAVYHLLPNQFTQMWERVGAGTKAFFQEWASSIGDSLRLIGKKISDFFGSIDFSSFLPDWAKGWFGDDSKGKASKQQIGKSQPNILMSETPKYETSSFNQQMKGELNVNIHTEPGTKASLEKASADNLRIMGSVGVSDRALALGAD